MSMPEAEYARIPLIRCQAADCCTGTSNVPLTWPDCIASVSVWGSRNAGERAFVHHWPAAPVAGIALYGGRRAAPERCDLERAGARLASAGTAIRG